MVLYIFSKEGLVAIFIILNSRCIEPNFNPLLFTSSEVYQARVIKSDNSKFLNYPLRISDFILLFYCLSRGIPDEHFNSSKRMYYLDSRIWILMSSKKARKSVLSLLSRLSEIIP